MFCIRESVPEVIIQQNDKPAQKDMNLHDYCTHIQNLNTEQCHIVMYNRAWCKSYISAIRHGQNQKDTEYFSVVQGVQAKVMLYISYKETCHIFSNTQ